VPHRIAGASGPVAFSSAPAKGLHCQSIQYGTGAVSQPMPAFRHRASGGSSLRVRSPQFRCNNQTTSTVTVGHNRHNRFFSFSFGQERIPHCRINIIIIIISRGSSCYHHLLPLSSCSHAASPFPFNYQTPGSAEPADGCSTIDKCAVVVFTAMAHVLGGGFNCASTIIS